MVTINIIYIYVQVDSGEKCNTMTTDSKVEHFFKNLIQT